MSADDPTSYTRANKKLEKAVIEHYRLVKKIQKSPVDLTSNF